MGFIVNHHVSHPSGSICCRYPVVLILLEYIEDIDKDTKL